MKTQVSVIKSFPSLQEAIEHATEYYSGEEWEHKLKDVKSNLENKSISKVGNGAIVLIVDEFGLLD